MNQWHTGTDKKIAEDCSFCGKKSATIILSDEILAVIAHLCKTIDVEWQMLLIGTDDGDVVRCTDYYIPKQEVSAASVKNLDCVDKARIDELGIVATIHSHSDMSVFFSSTDHESTNTSLIKNHIVWNNKGEYKATKAIVLPCGMTKFIDAIVTRDMPALPTIKKVKGFKKIAKETYAPVVVDHSHFGHFNHRGHQEQDFAPYEAQVIAGKRKKHALHF